MIVSASSSSFLDKNQINGRCGCPAAMRPSLSCSMTPRLYLIDGQWRRSHHPIFVLTTTALHQPQTPLSKLGSQFVCCGLFGPLDITPVVLGFDISSNATALMSVVGILFLD
jgi:hypothetical protein